MKEDSKYNEAYINAKKSQAEKGHEAESRHGEDRLPPGQILTEQFPILDLGIRPTREQYSSWELVVDGEVANPVTLTLEKLKGLGEQDIVADFHCVTTWSRYDIPWKGIHFEKIETLVSPNENAKFAILHSFDDYTTNIPIPEMRGGDVFVATALEGEDISPEHGGPIRMIIPKLYGWKSAKFLKRIELVSEDIPGFWETRGYSNTARPWNEERYS